MALIAKTQLGDLAQEQEHKTHNGVSPGGPEEDH